MGRTSANGVLFIPQREHNNTVSRKRLTRKTPLGKAMNSSIKNNILIDEFHGNVLSIFSLNNTFILQKLSAFQILMR